MAHKPEQNSQAIESDLERLELIYKRAASNAERPRALNRSVLERLVSLITDYRAEHMRLRTEEDEASVPKVEVPLVQKAERESKVEKTESSPKIAPASKVNGTNAARRRAAG